MKKLTIAALALSTTVAMASGAAAYKKCVGCHGVNGERKFGPQKDVIQGQSSERLFNMLKGYKDGSLKGNAGFGIMKGQVKRMSEDKMKELADYMATL